MNTEDKNYKRVEDMLYNYKNTKAEIKILKRKLEVYENNYDGVRGLSYDEKSTPTNKFNSDVENEVIRRVEEIQKLKNEIRLKEIEIENIDDAINALDERAAYVITEFYIKKRQLKVISSEVHLNENYSSDYKSSIINKIANLIFLK